MKFIDYYKVLGIDSSATTEEIKAAYYKLAKKYHPDRNNNDEKALVKFTLINEAFSVLSDIDKRIKYKIEMEKRDNIREHAKKKMKLLKNLEKNEITKYIKTDNK